MADSRLFRDEGKFSDQVARGVASAIDDIRHKVVEEGWFGRETTGSIELVGNAVDEAAEREKGVASFYGLDQAGEQGPKDPGPDIEPPKTPAVETERTWDRDEGMER
jgi:hypothetical protein